VVCVFSVVCAEVCVVACVYCSVVCVFSVVCAEVCVCVLWRVCIVVWCVFSRKDITITNVSTN
jgi:hypothetical protein